MANGDILVLDRYKVSYLLTDAQSLTDNGVWVERPGGYSVVSVHSDAVETGGTIDIHGSNAVTKPSNATSGVVVATLSPSLLAAGALATVYRWYKAKKTQGGTPAPSTIVVLFERAA